MIILLKKIFILGIITNYYSINMTIINTIVSLFDNFELKL